MAKIKEETQQERYNKIVYNISLIYVFVLYAWTLYIYS
jgi:hypothetical protein